MTETIKPAKPDKTLIGTPGQGMSYLLKHIALKKILDDAKRKIIILGPTHEYKPLHSTLNKG